jgi:hypothetical protein
MSFSDLLEPTSLQIIMLIIFGAFLLFFILYSFFALYHLVRYRFQSDHLTFPVLVVYLVGAGFLVAFTFIYLQLT